MKKGLFKLLLLIALVLALTFSFASCELLNGSDAAENESDSNSAVDVDSIVKEEHSHDFSDWIITTPATCDHVGEEARACWCGERESKAIDKLDHNYADGKCTLCGTDQTHVNMQIFDYSKI